MGIIRGRVLYEEIRYATDAFYDKNTNERVHPAERKGNCLGTYILYSMYLTIYSHKQTLLIAINTVAGTLCNRLLRTLTLFL